MYILLSSFKRTERVKVIQPTWCVVLIYVCPKCKKEHRVLQTWKEATYNRGFHCGCKEDKEFDWEGECPHCNGGPVYQDRYEASRGVAHCDDCGVELTAEEYKKICAKTN